MNSNRIEELFSEYIESEAAMREDELHRRWRRISAELDRKLAAGTLTLEDLAEYEEAAAHAAFQAGAEAVTEAE